MLDEMLMHPYMIELTSKRFFTMDSTENWLFAQEYPIWNVAVTALQFWTNDLNPQTLSSAIERVYTAFCYSDSAQHLWYVEGEILFGCFVTPLNDALEWELTSEDIRYESGSESLSVPTPLCQEPWPFHVSTQENLSFGSATPRACPSPSYLHAGHHWLTYEEDNESSLGPRMEDHSPEDDILAYHLPSIAEEEGDGTEEHFPIVSLDNDSG